MGLERKDCVMSIKTSVAVVVVLLAAPILAVAQTEWVDDPGNPVIPAPNPGDWDAQRYLGAVVEVDGTYHMYFNGRVAGSPGVWYYQTGHATSPDGVTWDPDPLNPVMTWGVEGEWDDRGLWAGAVIHDESGFRMWYLGNDGQFGRAGYATSTDGSDWDPYGQNPIIDVGPAGAFDEWFLKPLTVILRDGHYTMWYWASDFSWEWSVGLAESDDGLDWEKYPVAVLEDAWAPAVRLDGQIYSMWYSVGSSSHFDVAYAVSPDGLAWIPYSGNPVIEEAALPAVLYDSEDGIYTMWYTAYDFSIRRATSTCCGSVFFDGFESGDTSAWSATIP
jgi:hypothetical protein